MTSRPSRWSWTTMWAAAIVVLLPTLAWLQYSWLDQISAADRERRERTVRTAAAQLAQEFDLELGKALFALQIDGTMIDPPHWPAYAERYSSWSSAAANPRMVQSVYLATPATPAGRGALPALRRWNPQTQRFDSAGWPDDLRPLAARIAAHLDQLGDQRLFRRGDRPPPLVMSDDGDDVLVAPVIQVDADDKRAEKTEQKADDRDRRGDRRPAQARLAGFTILRLDVDVLRAEMLPAFVKRHFADESGRSDFRVAVVDRDTPTDVLFESEPGAATAALDHPDASTLLLAPHGHPALVVQRAGARGDQPDETLRPEGDRVFVNIIEARRDDRGGTIRTRLLGANGDGRWRLVAKHRAGSLEAAVAAARTRNFALSSGVLLLLSAAIGLIVVSARRADRLGRQQMEFVATVSHELRTPVSVIGAAAGNLADGVVADPARVRRYGETIQTEARRLRETVERVLQLAGLASDRPMAAASLAPAGLVEEALDACRPEIEAAGFTVEVDVADRLPAVAGDPTALRSALQNLIGNAVKYGREARWLRVAVRAGTGGRRGGEWVEFEVADRGPGIADADRAHVFEAFYRGRDAVSRQIQGSGLGLHLVRRIVDAHGGRVDVVSTPGGGCRFTIALPAESPSTQADARGRQAGILPGGAGAALRPRRSH